MSLHRAKHMPAVLLALCLAASTGCGGGGGGPGPEDTSTDTEEEDTGIDQGDVTPDTTPPDVTDTEEEGDATDVTEEDPAGHGGTAFISEGAGGAILTSTHFRLEVFVAPARPLGAGTSTNYSVTLGPAAVRAD